MADGGDFDGARWFVGVLDGFDDTRGSEKQHDYDENRNDCPGELNLIAAVDLRGGSATIVILALS